MVLLTVVTASNPHTLYFDHPIGKPNSIRLMSASLYNSWHNLKNRGGVTFYDKNNQPQTAPLLPGYYTPQTLAAIIEPLFQKAFGVKIPIQVNQPTGEMIIYNTTIHRIMLDTDLAELLGIDRELRRINYVAKLNSPSTYFVHCDLIDKKQHLLNGKPSTLLARFDIKGKALEKVSYQTPQPHVLRDAESGDYDVNSITLSVQDEKGNLFDFKGQPLEFEVETYIYSTGMNVLPSAPTDDGAQQQQEQEQQQSIYPTHELAQLSAEDFRLKKINDLLKELSDEAEHYRQVAKKYKRTHSIVHRSAVGLGSLSVGLSSGALATALTGFGILASPALAGVATVCGVSSVGFTFASKRLERKVTKHEKIYTLALAKRNSVNELVSQALADKKISDVEFCIITREVEKYHALKAEIRNGAAQAVTQDATPQTQGPDLEKLKEELRKEVKREFQKKVDLLTAVSKSDLNG